MRSFTRSLLSLTALFLLGATTLPAIAQSPHGGTSFRIPPKIECTLTTTIDSFKFVNKNYLPTTFTVTVCAKNVDPSIVAYNVLGSIVSNPRFIIMPPPTQLFADTLRPGEEVCKNFQLMITSSQEDVLDTIQSVITTSNGGTAVCQKEHWVEHEHHPKFLIDCSQIFSQLVWVDSTNDYSPNPFDITIRTILNEGDDVADSTQVLLILPPGYALEPGSINPVYVGNIAPNGTRQVTFRIRGVKSAVSTDDSIRIQVQGKGGLGNKLVIDTCVFPMSREAARQAEYQLKCDYLPDSIRFINHRYQPQPFDYKVDITNIGTANGVGVTARLILPPSISLNAGSPDTLLGSLAKGSTRTIVWRLFAQDRLKLDTVVICVRVTDKYNNSDSCCDMIIIDSIRCGEFGLVATCPDTIRVDTLNGVYINNPFQLKFLVSNIGNDYMDTIRATLSISDPDIVPMTPREFRIPIFDIGEDTLLTFICNALPRAFGSKVKFTLKVETVQGSCTETKTIECEVYVPRLAAPNIVLGCLTDPIDTVRFNPVTGKYEPDVVTLTIPIRNNGGAPAEEVELTPFIPPGFILAPGDSTTKKLDHPLTLSSKDTVRWRLIPLPRRDGGAMAGFCVQATSRNAALAAICCSVYVVELPHIAAISVTQDNVCYYTQEIKVPVTIDNSDGKDIYDINFEITFDPAIVSYVRPDQAGTLLNGWPGIVTNLVAPGRLRVRVINESSVLSGSGILMYLWFRGEFGARPNHLSIAATDVNFITAPLPSPEPLFNTALVGAQPRYPAVFVRTSPGKITVSGECIRPMVASDKYIISQNRPNPFNPSTAIDYAVPETTPVRIDVLDTFGRIVATPVNEIKEKGSYQVVFNGSQLPSGVYFYRMETPSYTKVMKMLLAR